VGCARSGCALAEWAARGELGCRAATAEALVEAEPAASPVAVTPAIAPASATAAAARTAIRFGRRRRADRSSGTVACEGPYSWPVLREGIRYSGRDGDAGSGNGQPVITGQIGLDRGAAVVTDTWRREARRSG